MNGAGTPGPHYNKGMLCSSCGRVFAVVLTSTLVAHAAGQTPAPFPRPGDPAKPTAPKLAPPQTPPPGTRVLPPQPASSPAAPGEPTEATLGAPIYRGADFVASYDAGRGQRYYLFGTTADFLQIVNYYKTVLKQKGELVYEEPPIHMFEIGRFREETMAFPPGVTVKDYTWGGSAGYLNPKRGAEPARYKTIIQIVPAPPVVPR
jgi:hypothetical protein